MNTTNPVFHAKYVVTDDQGNQNFFSDAAMLPADRLTDLAWISQHYGVDAAVLEKAPTPTPTPPASRY